MSAFARRARVKLHVLPAPGSPQPGQPQFHTDNVNAYHGRLKEWMRRFHGVAPDNLPSIRSLVASAMAAQSMASVTRALRANLANDLALKSRTCSDDLRDIAGDGGYGAGLGAYRIRLSGGASEY
jgi:hypothetical protein